MNRAERRAHKRAQRNKGSGFTSKPVHRSMKQIELMGEGIRRHTVVVERIQNGTLPLKRDGHAAT